MTALVLAPLVGWAALFVLDSPHRAFAAPPNDADALIREGVALRRKGADVEALQRFEQAFQLDNSPRALAQMGLAEQALGRWAMAYEHLAEALRSQADPWMSKNGSRIREALNLVGDHVGRLEILGGSAGAQVSIDGIVRGKLPLPRPLTLSTGTITIDLTAPGLIGVHRITTISGGQTIRESFDALAPVVAADRPVSTSAATVAGHERRPNLRDEDASGTVGPLPVDTTEPKEGAVRAERDEPSVGRTSLKWIAWGVGGAAAGIGIYGFIKQNSAADAFDGGCGVDPMGAIQPLPESSRTAQGCRDLKGRIDLNYRIEVIGFASAAVSFITGFALWLTEPSPSAITAVAAACSLAVTVESGPFMSCKSAF